MVESAQVPLIDSTKDWTIILSKEWDVLGPFPIHAREQHFLSPSFPLNLSEPIDFDKTWPSSYADRGSVSWSTARAGDNGDLNISFPAVRWEVLRATEGWGALQHHTILRTTLTLYPPPTMLENDKPPRLLVNLVQGSFFTILPAVETEHPHPNVPEWYSGNIYAMERALPQAVNLPILPSTTAPTKYNIFVSGDYEIRLFGDPRASDNEVPVLNIGLTVTVESLTEKVVLEPTHDVVCDFIDGFAFGDALGIGLRSVSGWWTVTHAVLANDNGNAIALEIIREIGLAPSQARIVPVRIVQDAQFHLSDLHIDLTVVSDATSAVTVVSAVLPVSHHPRWTLSSYVAIKASYFYAGSMPTAFLAIPPTEPNLEKSCAPLLALHGAGVDILGHDFWAKSLPRQKHSWIVVPSGRTSWGLDWHGPSAQDAWSSLDTLVVILEGNKAWHPWKMERNRRTVILGHSNGGQGAWYAASRNPDRVLAVVPAAAYIKSTAYVPLTQSRSAHFIDPSLRAILETSLTPDDNDLFLTNLVDTPILAIHGGNDDNVPTWHSREAVGIVKSWRPTANVTFREDSSERHWYPSVFDNDEVQAFLDAALNLQVLDDEFGSRSFTLTVSIPHESGPLHGWRIESLCIPGRLARIDFKSEDGAAVVKTSNVYRFSIDAAALKGITQLTVDGTRIPTLQNTSGVIRFIAGEPCEWTSDRGAEALPGNPQLSGRMQTILMSSAPLSLIIPDGEGSRELGVALRVAHDLDTYHKLDAEIISSFEALQKIRTNALSGNIIVVGDAHMPFLRSILRQKKTPFELEGSLMKVKHRVFNEPSSGILFLHPHPTNLTSNMMVVSGTDSEGLERALRLFPIRTGVAVPDWMVIGSNADRFGAGGVVATGTWGRDWEWNEPISLIN